MTDPNVLSLFPPPSLEDCENAISRALLRLRADGHHRDELARKLNCSASTIDNASNCRTQLHFESVALLAYHYPDVWPLIEGLWSLRPIAKPTLDDRIERIERELDAIREQAA
ncbi:MAG: hypothetical protein WCL10_18935 [Novosphingobium sp.]|uniref:hypothetical protein n=1 Tax=Novosphingobium sp. TaxID=1874826 RepID=UPI00301998B7